MSNLYTRLLGAITTTRGGITLCNYLRKYLGKTHVWLCHAHERGKKQRRRWEKEKASGRLCDLSLWWLGLSRWRGYEAITKALQMHPANLLTWKIKQRQLSVPLKTLRYMAAFVIIMGQVLN